MAQMVRPSQDQDTIPITASEQPESQAPESKESLNHVTASATEQADTGGPELAQPLNAVLNSTSEQADTGAPQPAQPVNAAANSATEQASIDDPQLTEPLLANEEKSAPAPDLIGAALNALTTEEDDDDDEDEDEDGPNVVIIAEVEDREEDTVRITEETTTTTRTTVSIPQSIALGTPDLDDVSSTLAVPLDDAGGAGDMRVDLRDLVDGVTAAGFPVDEAILVGTGTGGVAGLGGDAGGFEATGQPGGPVTHGDVLEAVAITCADMPVTPAQAAAIQSVEAHALGEPGGAGGLGSAARSAADKNMAPPRDRAAAVDELITMGDVLQDARFKLARDRPVTLHDAVAVETAEARNNRSPDEKQIGVAAAELQAAIMNR